MIASSYATTARGVSAGAAAAAGAGGGGGGGGGTGVGSVDALDVAAPEPEGWVGDVAPSAARSSRRDVAASNLQEVMYLRNMMLDVHTS
jgi:hypothetical protein